MVPGTQTSAVIDLLSSTPVGIAPPVVLTVSALTRAIRTLLEEAVGEVWVEGEISNYRRQGSGHHYFTLKDGGAQLACVVFRGDGVLAASGLGAGGHAPPDGAQVQAFGRLTVYEARGQHQLVVQLLQPKGLGALQARFEALKRKLHGEGLFGQERKRALPRFPRTVGLVTSPTGAALQDMLNVLGRRAPWMRVLVHPVRVQGRGAAAEIARAVAEFNLWKNVEIVVLARGGGSLEDLWEFNEEIVARALAASVLPTVSAVGHEIDFTIADFVADLRAPTPSAAAELIAPDTAELRRQIEGVGENLTRRLRSWVEQNRQRLDAAATRPARSREPRRRLDDARQRLDAVEEDLHRAGTDALARTRERIERLSAVVNLLRPERVLADRRESLDCQSHRLSEAAARAVETLRHRLCCTESLLRVLGPQATLERGYSITTDPATGRVLHRTDQVNPGMELRTQLSDGVVVSQVGTAKDKAP